MKAVDTNVLIRFLVGDEQEMMQKVCDLFEQAQERRERLLITTPVLLEVFWVLQTSYDFGRADILDAVETLAALPALEFERNFLPENLVECGRGTNLDLADILIGLSARAQGCETTLSFDKRALRSNLFEPV